MANPLGRLARQTHRDARQLETALWLHEDVSNFVETRAAIAKLVEGLEKEFDLSKVGKRAAAGPASKTPLRDKTRVQLQNMVRYQLRRRRKEKRRATEESTALMGSRIASAWFVRCMLADPTVPLKSLEAFCQQFHLDEAHAISAARISSVRDCFAELLKVLDANAIYDAFRSTFATSENGSISMMEQTFAYVHVGSSSARTSAVPSCHTEHQRGDHSCFYRATTSPAQRCSHVKHVHHQHHNPGLGGSFP